MNYLYYILAFVLIALTYLPLIKNQHWFFRIASFARIQILVLIVPLFVWGHTFLEISFYPIILVQILLGVSFVYQLTILAPYFSFFSKKKIEKSEKTISILSVNVYQYNTDHQKLIDIVNSYKPDIFLTLESNQDWENSLSVLDTTYKKIKKIALENTYGMHFYTNLEVVYIKTNYFVADDIPSIEVQLKTKQGEDFVFYGIHPPPASPTEELSSKEKDGELLSVAKKIKKETLPVIITGDFNSVAWSRITKLFTQISGLIDARKGRGFIATFPVKYPLLRVPIDLLFHTQDFKISTLKTLKSIKSDHFPLYIECQINLENKDSSKNNTSLKTKKEVNHIITKGIKENSNQR